MAPESEPRQLDFSDHRRELDANRYVYAVVSRRAQGVSIGVNLNPDKVCNFECPYCQVDRTTPGGPPEVDVARLGEEVSRLLKRLRQPDVWEQPPFDTVATPLRRLADIAFSGDGEPTSAPELRAAAREVAAVRDVLCTALPLRLLTNAVLLDRPRVRAALSSFDELWCKLDAGTEAGFHAASGTRLPFARVLANISAVARVRPVTLQSLFMARDGCGPAAPEIEAYVARLAEIRDAGGTIEQVQVYTVARRPADPRVSPLDREQLDAIAALVRALGLRAEVYV